MPRKKSYSLVTVLRKGEDVDSVSVDENLNAEQLSMRLTASPPPGYNVDRIVFSGDPIPWAPSVRLGAKPAEQKKPRKPREEKKPNGTRFDESGTKAGEQGEAHGA